MTDRALIGSNSLIITTFSVGTVSLSPAKMVSQITQLLISTTLQYNRLILEFVTSFWTLVALQIKKKKSDLSLLHLHVHTYTHTHTRVNLLSDHEGVQYHIIWRMLSRHAGTFDLCRLLIPAWETCFCTWQTVKRRKIQETATNFHK